MFTTYTDEIVHFVRFDIFSDLLLKFCDRNGMGSRPLDWAPSIDRCVYRCIPYTVYDCEFMQTHHTSTYIISAERTETRRIHPPVDIRIIAYIYSVLGL